MEQVTRFGSLRHFEKGGVEVINDDARNYVFSNIFEVASKARPYEKVAVGKNIEYVIEAIRAEGTSGWRAPAQDEFALVMDGEVEIRLLKLADPGVVPAGTTGSIGLAGHAGRPQDGRGARPARPHDAPARGRRLPVPRRAARAWCCCRPWPARDTVERWAEICQTIAAAEAPERRSERHEPDHRDPPRDRVDRAQPPRLPRPSRSGSFTLQPRRVLRRRSRWPKGHHMLPVDAFLRALQRDIAWGFFYGIVNFDAVVGTVNHYGSVDLFAGRFNEHYRKAGLDHSERFTTPLIQRVFEAMLEDWTNAALRSVREPAGDGQRVRPQERQQQGGDHPPPGHGQAHGRRARRRAGAHATRAASP